MVYHEKNENGLDCAIDDIAARVLEPKNTTTEPLAIEPIEIERAYELAQQGTLANRYEF